MEQPELKVNGVSISHCGDRNVPRRLPSSLVIKTIDGQENTYEGELLYIDSGVIAKFKVALNRHEIAILQKLARRVSERMHRTLRLQQDFTEEEWSVIQQMTPERRALTLAYKQFQKKAPLKKSRK
jgi:hypothetical protein